MITPLSERFSIVPTVFTLEKFYCIVFDYLQANKMTAMANPPYSPDLAPSDFWLFGHLKRNLELYPDSTSLARAITKDLNSKLHKFGRKKKHRMYLGQSKSSGPRISISYRRLEEIFSL